MSNNTRTELDKREILRLSNEESNKLTKECLQTALMQLMSEKAFEKITITELVKRSGVSRSAFYRNYHTKEDILVEINSAIMQLLTEAFSGKEYLENPLRFYRTFFQSIKENADVFHLYLQANLQNKSTFMKLAYPETDDSVSRRGFYKITAFKSAFIQIIYEWFQNGMQDEVDEMAQICVSILSVFLDPES